MRDEWDEKLEMEQEIIYLSLHLSHVPHQCRRVAVKVPSLPSMWAGVRTCQFERPEASTGALLRTARRFLRHFVRSSLLHRLRRESPHPGASTHPPICLLVLYWTFETIYDPSEQWTAQFSEPEGLIVISLPRRHPSMVSGK